MSANQFNLLVQDVIRALVYCAVCLVVQRGRNSSQHPAAPVHLLYLSINYVTLLRDVASECHHCLSVSVTQPNI